DQGVAADLDLVAGIGHCIDAADGDVGGVGAVHVVQVDAVGGVVVDEGVLDEPLAAGGGGAQAVAVAAGLLGPAGPGFAGGDAFAAAVPADFDVAQDDLAGVGAGGAEVAVPADAAVLV